MTKEKGPEWNYVTVLADGGDKGLAYALCTFSFRLQAFTIFFRINAFINVYYIFLDVYHIYAWPHTVFHLHLSYSSNSTGL